MTTAVVLLNYNGAALLDTYLPPLLQHTDATVQCCIIDNGSTDDSIQVIQSYGDQLRLIRLPENLGFAGGYNAGLRHIDADIYILLNTDVRVTAGWLPPLLQKMQDERVGICVPKIMDDSNADRFEYAGAAGGYLDRLGYAYCRGRVFDRIEEDQGQYDDDVDVHWAGGCAMVIRSALYHGIGGFDERFFAHYEEIDLCWRVRHSGHTVTYVSSSTIYHLGGGTMSYDSPRKLMLNFRNSLFMLTKNLRGYHAPWVIFQRLLLDGVAALVFLVEGKWSHIGAVLKAHFAFYWQLPYLLRRRHQDQRLISQIAHPGATYTTLSGPLLIWQFFIKRRHTYQSMQSAGVLNHSIDR